MYSARNSLYPFNPSIVAFQVTNGCAHAYTRIHIIIQGFPKLTKILSHLPVIVIIDQY